MPPTKRKAEVSSDGEDDSPPKTKAKSKRQPPPTEPYTGPDGWTVYPPFLLYKEGKAEPSEKIAALDLDGTLVGIKSTSRWPTGPDDYKLFNKKVGKVLKGWHDDGYKLVIFSNQGMIKSALEGDAAKKVKGRIDNVIKELDLPIQAFAATAGEPKGGAATDKYRKPQTGMWEHMVENCNGGIAPDLKECFFVGDAAGRPDDFADSDKKFAENVGIAFKTPEDAFGEGLLKKSGPKPQEGGVNHNEALTSALRQLAAKKEEEGGNAVFAARTYNKVAGIVEGWPKKIENGKELSKMQGVGKGTVAKIDEFIKNGTLADLETATGKAEGGDAEAKQAQAKSKGADMASKFL